MHISLNLLAFIFVVLVMFVIKYILEPVQFRIYSNLNSFGVSQISKFESHIIFFPNVHRFAISENAGTFMKKPTALFTMQKKFFGFFFQFCWRTVRIFCKTRGRFCKYVLLVRFIIYVKCGDFSANMYVLYWSVSQFL